MDSKFQQSFIPKESLGNGTNFGPGPGLGVFALIAIVIFLISAGAFGVTYLYKQSVANEISKLETDLARMQEIFQPATIAEFKKLSNRLSIAEKLINNHSALSQVFGVLETATLKSVYFKSFGFINNDKGFSLSLGGVAKNFSSVALQSDVFSQKQVFKSLSFSNLNLDSKGNVVFDVAASVDPAFLSYKNNVAQPNQWKISSL